jgi:hypothetical protein
MATKSASGEFDWDDVEEGGGGSKVRVPEGDYKAKIKAVVFQTAQSGNPMLVWTIVGTEGRLKGKELKEYTVLTKKAAWKLHDLLDAAVGKKPSGKMSHRKVLEWCKKNALGKEIGVTLEDDEYTNDKGKTTISSKISDYMDVDDVGSAPPDDDDEDIEDEDDDESEDDEDEDEDDGLDDMDRLALKKHIKSEDLDIVVKKSMSDDDIRAAIRAASDDDEEEIEDVDLDEL